MTNNSAINRKENLVWTLSDFAQRLRDIERRLDALNILLLSESD